MWYLGGCATVRTAAELPVLARASLLGGTPGYGLPVRAAAVLEGVARTALRQENIKVHMNSHTIDIFV